MPALFQNAMAHFASYGANSLVNCCVFLAIPAFLHRDSEPVLQQLRFVTSADRVKAMFKTMN